VRGSDKPHSTAQHVKPDVEPVRNGLISRHEGGRPREGEASAIYLSHTHTHTHSHTHTDAS
jgi:hypothetical protein